MCKFSAVLKLAALSVAILTAIDCSAQPALRNSDAPPLRGKLLNDTLAKPIPGWSWTGQAFRQVVARIERDSRISILCDRRVNPDEVVTFEASGMSVRQAIERLAQTVDATSIQIGNTIFIGPPLACEYVETLIELRREEARQLPVAVRRKLAELHSVRWEDLTTPKTVLDQIAQTSEIEFEQTSDVPYDLMRGDSIDGVSPIAAGCLLLIQFQMTFEWNKDSGEMTLAAITRRPVISRSFRTRPGQGSRQVARWREAIPDLKFDVRGSQVIATGSAADLAKFDVLKTTGKLPGEGRPVQPDVVPLQKRLFTLKIRDVSALALMKQLETSGIEFKYSPAALKNAKVDLNQFVEFQVSNVSPEEFFHAVFEPLGVDFTIRGNTVELSPAEK